MDPTTEEGVANSRAVIGRVAEYGARGVRQVAPVLDCGDRLGYVHIGESHRGYLGTGNVDFDGLFKALVRVGYSGPVVFESFSFAVVSPTLSRNLGSGVTCGATPTTWAHTPTPTSAVRCAPSRPSPCTDRAPTRSEA